jgi:hypothetical protein
MNRASLAIPCSTWDRKVDISAFRQSEALMLLERPGEVRVSLPLEEDRRSPTSRSSPRYHRGAPRAEDAALVIPQTILCSIGSVECDIPFAEAVVLAAKYGRR